MSKRTLIITTAKLVNEEQWDEEIIKYFGYYPESIELISHQKITRRYDEYIDKKYDLVVIDEAHKIKALAKANRGVKISRLIKRLTKRAEYVVPMTGTPIGNDFIDIFNIYNNCDIKMWYGWSQADFIKAYYHHYQADFLGLGFKTTIAIALRESMKPTLWKLVRKKAMIVKTNDVVDLKGQILKIIKVDGMDTTDVYKQLNKRIIKYKNYEDTLIKFKERNFKHQAAQGFIYEEGYDKEVYRFNNNKLDKFKKKIVDILAKIDKVVITYFFIEDYEAITNILDELGITHTQSRKAFKKNKRVFMLHHNDCEGLNLQDEANGMIFFSFTDSYLKFTQLCGRIARRGQKKVCYYFVFMSMGTIEEEMWQNVKIKKEKDDFIKNELKEN
jgi:hypothetical protein